MSRGMDISAGALDVLAMKQEILANNLANSNTVGYKSDAPIMKAFPSVFSKVLGERAGGVKIDEVGLSKEQGNIMPTGNKLDVALRGTGFFVVETSEGERYTRNGNFTLNASGQLVTQDGRIILGENGPVTVSGSDVSINSEGEIVVDGQRVNKLKVVDFAQPYQLEKKGGNLYAPRDATVSAETKPPETELIQSFLESSDVNVIKTMTEMIALTRSFELNQKAILAQNDMMVKSVRDIGSTR